MRSVALEVQLTEDLFLGPGITELSIEYLELGGTHKDHIGQLPAPCRTT